jgi:hypothetical protein
LAAKGNVATLMMTAGPGLPRLAFDRDQELSAGISRSLRPRYSVNGLSPPRVSPRALAELMTPAF